MMWIEKCALLRVCCLLSLGFVLARSKTPHQQFLFEVWVATQVTTLFTQQIAYLSSNSACVFTKDRTEPASLFTVARRTGRTCTNP